MFKPVSLGTGGDGRADRSPIEALIILTMKVFVLQHVHEIAPDNEDVKLIGVYSTEDDAKKAVDRAVILPGFRDAPAGFRIDGYELDEDHWTEGYVTMS